MNTGAKPIDEAFRVWIERETGKSICGTLGESALAVYWALACHRPNVRPCLSSLCETLGRSRTQIKFWIRRLEEHGFVVRSESPGHATTYILTDSTPGRISDRPPNEVGRNIDLHPVGKPTGGESDFASNGGRISDPEEDNRKKTIKEDKLRKTKPRRNAAVSADKILVPSSLDVPEVRKALADWIAYKRAKGQGYKRAEHLERKVSEFPTAAGFVAAVNHSIGCNYAGIFPPREGQNGTKRTNGRNTNRASAGTIHDPANPIGHGF